MILVTGANGQVGTEIKKRLGAKALSFNRTELDIQNLKSLQEIVAKHKVQSIINCAAYTKVDLAEDEGEKAFAINQKAVSNLVSLDLPLIHFSTDYVFNGHSLTAYTEKDECDPIGVYGHSKRAGELEILEKASRATIIRTSWVYASHGQNFLKTMLKLGSERDSLGVVADQIGTPTFAGDIADMVVSCLPNFLGKTGVEIYHYSNEGVCSWYDFAHEIFRQAGIHVQLNPIETKDYPTKAKRPQFSLLSKKKVKSNFKISIPHWSNSLTKCLAEI